MLSSCQPFQPFLSRSSQPPERFPGLRNQSADLARPLGHNAGFPSGHLLRMDRIVGLFLLRRLPFPRLVVTILS